MDFTENLKQEDPQIFKAIEDELNRQQNQIELIASENIVSKAVLEAQGSILTNKYAEGYSGRRYYHGCEFVDVVENFYEKRFELLLLLLCERVLDYGVALIHKLAVALAQLLALFGEFNKFSPRVALGKIARYIPARSEVRKHGRYRRRAQVELVLYVALAHLFILHGASVHKDERLKLRARYAERGEIFAVAPLHLPVYIAH